jgi:hypothetical protein
VAFRQRGLPARAGQPNPTFKKEETMQSGKFLSLVLAITMIFACAPNQALTDMKQMVVSYEPVSEEFDVKFDDARKVRIRIEWSDHLKCVARVLYRTPDMKEFKAADNKVQPSVVTEADKAASKIISCGALGGNQRCETCIFITQRNPIGVWVYIGNIPYFICIYGC